MSPPRTVRSLARPPILALTSLTHRHFPISHRNTTNHISTAATAASSSRKSSSTSSTRRRTRTRRPKSTSRTFLSASSRRSRSRCAYLLSPSFVPFFCLPVVDMSAMVLMASVYTSVWRVRRRQAPGCGFLRRCAPYHPSPPFILRRCPYFLALVPALRMLINAPFQLDSSNLSIETRPSRVCVCCISTTPCVILARVCVPSLTEGPQRAIDRAEAARANRRRPSSTSMVLSPVGSCPACRTQRTWVATRFFFRRRCVPT